MKQKKQAAMKLGNASTLTALLLLTTSQVSAFQTPHNTLSLRKHQSDVGRTSWCLHQAQDDEDDVDVNELKSQLTEYLSKREELNADGVAKDQVGRVVGGTKGNPILEYVSGSPNKEYVIDEAPNVFDYDELVGGGCNFIL